MKKIAVITDGWKKYITYSWVDGLMVAAREVGLDVIVYAYNTNGNLSYDPKHNAGEYNLYTLPDYSAYDGIVFDCTNTRDEEEIARIVEVLKKSGKPVVSIAYYVDGFYYVGNDNKKLFRAMIDHLYEKHGVRDMIFAGGPTHNYENMQRYEAFREAMTEYGLPADESRVIFGEYDFGSGERYFKEWVGAGKKLPEAFVCANDNIAAGICSQADRMGYAVPRDFLVTGFDNLDKAAFYRPQIATVEHNRGNVISYALHILMDLWEGKEVDPFTYLYSEVIPAESCGCENNGRINYRDYAKGQIDWNVLVEKNDDSLSVFENKMAECESFEGIFKGLSDYLDTKDCGGIYIVVNKGLLEADPANRFPKNGYDLRQMTVAYAYENHERLSGIRSVKELKSRIEYTGCGCSFLFFPIHFRDEIVGFTILKNAQFLYDQPFFYNIHALFITKLESMYKQTQLSNAVSAMKELYDRDSLTGLYNRVAYNEMIEPRFRQFKREQVSCAMIFFDVDYFKDINDTLGHDYGDRVLVTIARVLQDTKPKDGFAYRFGGDEFVVFFPYATEKKIETFLQAAQKLLLAQNLHVSHGVVVTDPESDVTLDEYLVRADEEMYALKAGRKRTSGKTREELLPRLFEDEDRSKFYKGVDISSLPEHLDGDEKFYDENGNEKDPFVLLKENGINSVRLRIWNEPENVPESGGYCDLDHTLRMAKLIRDNGMHFMLDFHYSDFWADPGHQKKPKAWEDLDFDELVAAVYDFTRDTLKKLAAIDCLPDMVQVGNEIRSGMLFPDGAVPQYEKLARLVNAGIRAVREISAEIKVLIHLDQGGRFYYLKEWFDSMFQAGMDEIDAIGISFYSFWHGTYMDLKDSMKQLIECYNVPVYVVETAHPWRQCAGEHVSEDLMKTAGLPAGKQEQKKALEIVMQAALEASQGLDTGIYYWEPLCIPGKTYGSWDENMGMLDEHGRALPAFRAYKNFNPRKPAIEDLDAYMESLYAVKEEELPAAGTNLVPNGDFSEGLSGWWVTRYPEEVLVEEKDREVMVSAKCNFTFKLNRELRVEKAGRYSFSLDYRGTNTTGVQISMFLKTITCNGETTHEKTIFPQDVRFMTYSMELDLPRGLVQLGLEMNTPPVFGRIKNIRLTEI